MELTEYIYTRVKWGVLLDKEMSFKQRMVFMEKQGAIGESWAKKMQGLITFGLTQL